MRNIFTILGFIGLVVCLILATSCRKDEDDTINYTSSSYVLNYYYSDDNNTYYFFLVTNNYYGNNDTIVYMKRCNAHSKWHCMKDKEDKSHEDHND
jgi:hypothetical protein